MQNIKNFKLKKPTKKQLAKYATSSGDVIQFLISEDGQDWYDCQAQFADDTVKIMYDADGIIRSVVDKPVPQRGNIYAVSMFFPLDMSVAEMAVTDYPKGVTLDGTWKFDGETVYRDASIVDVQQQASNASQYNRLLVKAVTAIVAIQSSAAAGNPREGDAQNLLALQQYVDQLRDVDVTAVNPAWPAQPSFLV